MSLINKIQERKEDFKSVLSKSNLSVFLFSLFILAVFATESFRALSSITIISIVVLSVFCINKDSIKNIKLNKGILLLCLVFLIHLIDAFHTDFLINSHYFFGRIMIKLPFLVLPFCILILPKLSEKHYRFLMLVFVLCSVYIGIKATLFYIGHQAEVQELYLRSKTLPLPLNHVRFSLMLSMAIFLSAYLYIKKQWFWHPVETKIMAGITIFLFLFLHLLSVRSGLLAFYTLALIVAFVYAWQTKKYKIIAIAVGLALFIPSVSYLGVPTFKNKVKNTIEDMRNTKYEYYANFHSMTARVFSYKVAFHLIKENPLLGVGIGNLEREVQKTYITNYSEIRPASRLMPHNQFIDFLVAFGFLGTLIFCLGFYGVLLFKKYRKNVVLLVQFLIITISFLFESTLETQLGANYTLAFLLIPLYFTISNAKGEEENI